MLVPYKVYTAPPYLVCQFTRVADIPNRRRLRSASTTQLNIPSIRLPTVGSRAFPVAGASVWNSLHARRCHVRTLSADVQTPLKEIFVLLLLQHYLILLVCYSVVVLAVAFAA